MSDWHEIAYVEFPTTGIETHTPARPQPRKQRGTLWVEALAMYGLLSLVIHAVVIYEVLR